MPSPIAPGRPYFVDADGIICGSHFGERRYEQSERLIQRLLGVDGLGVLIGVLGFPP